MIKNAKYYRELAAERLNDHTYTQKCSDGFNEIWECTNDGSSIYGFSICITRFGISIVGDIGSLTLKVGSDYGMEFLAGDDVGYYIHSKLESEFRNRVDYVGAPKQLARIICLYIKDKEVRRSIYDIVLGEHNSYDGEHGFNMVCNSLNDEIGGEVYDHFYKLQQPSEEIMWRLYAANHAAKEILAHGPNVKC